ncbi:MAG: sensor histidine kinase [Nitrospirota bacterium]
MLDFFHAITPIYLIFMLYGATFLFLGVAIAGKDMKGSDLQLANSLWLLAAFGFLHGAHEWMELGPLIEGDHLTFQQIFSIKIVSTALVVISFLFLLQFGISLVRSLGGKGSTWAAYVPVLLVLVWAAHVWFFGFEMEDFHIDMQVLRQANISARYSFGFAGGLMTAYGLIAYARKVSDLSRSVSRNLHYAGITFVFYGVFAGIFSFSYTLPLTPVPIVAFRGVAAIFVTYFIIKALNIFDIELRMKYEQQTKAIIQAEKLSSLGRLAAGIAHEINNPLTNASLSVQMMKNKLKRGVSESEISEKLNAVERNIDRASLIARELLQFSRQRDTTLAPLNINDVIASSLTLLRHRLGRVELTQNLAEVPDVLGDAVKLEQVFINILENALDAMPEGGRLSISTERNNGMVESRVTDSGGGIPEENLSRVFDPFFTTKEIGQGTGLGLAISYGIIKQHHGEISIVNVPTPGTMVTIKLPVKEDSSG